MMEKKLDKRIYKFKVPKDLMELSQLFVSHNKKIYVVGGFIRDNLLQIKSNDIDLCGSMKFADIQELLQNTNWQVKETMEKLGTCKIISKDKSVSYEYATFRVEEYDKGRVPKNVQFVDDMAKDVMRRDFSVNSMYYDIETNEVYDFFGGIEDCENRVVRPISSDVFKVDGVRILRMFRLAYTKNLTIPGVVRNSAMLNRCLLDSISNKRIIQELKPIFYLNERGNIFPNLHYMSIDFVKDFFKFRLAHRFFSTLDKYIDLDKFYLFANADYSLFELAEYDTILTTLYVIVKTIENVNLTEFPTELYGEMLLNNGLNLSKNVAFQYRIICDGLITLDKMIDKSLYVNYVQLFFPVIDMIIYCKKKMIIMPEDNEKLQRLIATNELMVANNIPRSTSELDLLPSDIVDRWPSVPAHDLNTILDCALLIATSNRRNEKEYLLKELEKIMEAYNKYKGDKE